MSIAAKLRRAPVRIAAGAYILNSGIGKLKADEGTAQGLHGMATGAYPFLNKLTPTPFTRALAVTETALGAALLLPVIPAGLVGIGLTAFAGGLVGLYARTEGVHDRYYRPVGNGVGLAKDLWLAAIGVGLVVDAALSESPITRTES
ncbi:hypothetical protein [Nakamurella endophytica]|uniref:DoxX family membrane protein n=1 Tax=Nakamurella endophytica TaxID=1748367 RepID=A0A917SKW0_9ACTN|nr:hypothetical protein [Nakamurella endophytica]GGL87151.1 hypothetical protein GCM10011594_03440 [Nakamurella endophytica]